MATSRDQSSSQQRLDAENERCAGERPRCRVRREACSPSRQLRWRGAHLPARREEFSTQRVKLFGRTFIMTIRKNTSLLAAISGLALALGSLSWAVPVRAEDTHNTRFRTPLKHVVVIFQENRTPDNLFQGLCHPPFGH